MKKTKRDSKYEDYFAEWLDELKSIGYVEYYEEQILEILFKGFQNLRPAEYTYDFRIKWTKEGIEALGDYFYAEDLISSVEIKPEYDFKNSTAMTTLKIKWLYQLKGIYVNIIKPMKSSKSLFARTFVPLSCKSMKGKSIKEWLNESANTVEQKSSTRRKSTAKKPIEKATSAKTVRKKVS